MRQFAARYTVPWNRAGSTNVSNSSNGWPKRAGQSPHQMRRAHSPSTRDPRLRWRRPAQEQQPGVVRDQMKPSILGAEVPAHPGVTRPALQRRAENTASATPHTVPGAPIPHRLPDLGQGAQIMMRLHQGTEPSFLFRTDTTDNHVGQIHPVGLRAPPVHADHVIKQRPPQRVDPTYG